MSVFKTIAAGLAKAFEKVAAPAMGLYRHQQAYHRITYPGHDPVNPQPTFWDRDFSHLHPRQGNLPPYIRVVK